MSYILCKLIRDRNDQKNVLLVDVAFLKISGWVGGWVGEFIVV